MQLTSNSVGDGLPGIRGRTRCRTSRLPTFITGMMKMMVIMIVIMMVVMMMMMVMMMTISP